MGHLHLLDEIFALTRCFSINFGVTGLFAFASQPGNGFEKGTVSCGVCFFFLKHFFCKPSLVLSGTGRFLAAEEIIPGVCVPHAHPVPWPPALEPFPFRLLPAGCLCIPSSMPADVGCFHWLLGLWVFVFPREVRWKEEDNRMLGFFP